MFPGLTRTMVILAAILDLRTLIEIYMTLYCFNGSEMVINLCIDANIFILGAFLSEIEPLYWCLFWPGGHFGRLLNLQVTISLYMSFDCFRWLTRVNNIPIDAIIFTPSAFLSRGRGKIMKSSNMFYGSRCPDMDSTKNFCISYNICRNSLFFDCKSAKLFIFQKNGFIEQKWLLVPLILNI